MSQEYFELLGLSPAFNIDLGTLESNFRRIQSESHPDRFVTASERDQLSSMQTATLANAAYQALKDSANRAKYLLELKGITAISETNTAMPMDFLNQQMEWRERIEEAKISDNIKGLEDLLIEIKKTAEKLQESLIFLLDEIQDYIAATDTTRKLIFINKVTEDINKAIEQLET